MGKHYRADVEEGSLGFLRAMWKTARWCQWVEPNDGAEGEHAGVLFYRNRNGHGVTPNKIEKPANYDEAAKDKDLPSHLKRQWYEL
jgi:omega-6 fatty acid desaturase (delta-12 desaturase)